jgi:hypothetical protein
LRDVHAASLVVATKLGGDRFIVPIGLELPGVAELVRYRDAVIWLEPQSVRAICPISSLVDADFHRHFSLQGSIPGG